MVTERTEHHTLNDFQVVTNTNMRLIASRRMTNKNMCSKIGTKYQTSWKSSDWMESQREATGYRFLATQIRLSLTLGK